MTMTNFFISTLVSMVDDKQLVLPAMQRPFVWEKYRILRLIDSLLRDFPLGALLIWDTDEAQRYRPFTRDAVSGEQPLFNFPQAEENRRLQYVLDGQQRLTALYIALRGTLDGRRLYVDLLSGDPGELDPGDMYYGLEFLEPSEVAARNAPNTSGMRGSHYVPLSEACNQEPLHVNARALDMQAKLGLSAAQRDRVVDTLTRASWAVRSERPLHVIVIDQHGVTRTPVEEILEIFVRVNSGGLVLHKADLLMSLLDLKWNDVQPALIEVARRVSKQSPVPVTRDMILKTALLAINEESRFDRLVKDRQRVEAIAEDLKKVLPVVERGWQKLAIVLRTGCRIQSARFFRNATNALLPFALWLGHNPTPDQREESRVVVGIYVALMSGVFGGAEARMGAFARANSRTSGPFPLEKLAALARQHRPITGLDSLLQHHRDLTLNIVQPNIVLDDNPDGLERDHIFPRATLEKDGEPAGLINHYANFHFLRGTDNRNKTDKPPHKWFREPGDKAPPYSEQDLADRLLTWDLIDPGEFKRLVEVRSAAIRAAALKLFHMDQATFEGLFK